MNSFERLCAASVAVVKRRNKAAFIRGSRLQSARAPEPKLNYAVLEARMAPMEPVISQEGVTMKARLNEMFGKLAVALGLIEPPRMQPIPVRAQREQDRRRH